MASEKDVMNYCGPKRSPETYFELYQVGDCQPIGVIRGDVIDDVIRCLPVGSHEKYWAREMPPQKSRIIQENMVGIEKLL